MSLSGTLNIKKRGEGGIGTLTIIIIAVVFFLLFLAIVGIILKNTGVT